VPDPDFAKSDEEAEQRYAKYRELDPLPSIAPALLNSGQLADYVAATGLLYPFDYNKTDALKPASYEVSLGGEFVYWDDAQASIVEGELKEGDEFWLRPNSLVFLTLEPMFRVPQYIALRFNLRISHVYKGLLVGTGPLVDPGFHGRLSLPLHNLTANSYRLVGGEGVIWVEATKTQPVQSVKTDAVARHGRVVDLPENKRDLTLREYLRKADPNQAIRSSIPGLVAGMELRLAESQRVSQRAVEAVENERRQDVLAGFLTLVGIIVAVLALALALHQIIDATNTRVDSTNSRIDQLVKVQATPQTNAGNQQQLDALNARLCRVEPPAQQVADHCPAPSPTP
jgi:deoxycytidine triphosphate deaminase